MITMTDASKGTYDIFEEVALFSGVNNIMNREDAYIHSDLEKKELLKAEASILMRSEDVVSSLFVDFNKDESDFYNVIISIHENVSKKIKSLLLNSCIERLEDTYKINDFIDSMRSHFSSGVSIAKPKIPLSVSILGKNTVNNFVINEVKRRSSSQVSLMFSKFVDTGYIPQMHQAKVSRPSIF